MESPVTIFIPGYSSGVAGDIPAINNAGGSAIFDMQTDGLPPVIWMFLFLIIGYVGLRMLLEGK